MPFLLPAPLAATDRPVQSVRAPRAAQLGKVMALYSHRRAAYAVDAGLIWQEGEMLCFGGQHGAWRLPLGLVTQIPNEISFQEAGRGAVMICGKTTHHDYVSLSCGEICLTLWNREDEDKASALGVVDTWMEGTSERGSGGAELPPLAAQPSPSWERLWAVGRGEFWLSAGLFLITGIVLFAVQASPFTFGVFAVSALLLLWLTDVHARKWQSGLRNSLRLFAAKDIQVQPGNISDLMPTLPPSEAGGDRLP